MVLWAAAAGVLGGESRDGEEESLNVGMGFALVEMTAWFIGGVVGSVKFCCAGRRHSKARNLG